MPKSTNQKDQIVAAALDLFATRGYASTPISLIAKTAKVSQGLMYNFYPGKEQLLAAIMEKGFEDIRTSMAAYHDNSLSPAAAIELHVKSTFKIIREHEKFWRLLHTIRLQEHVLKHMKEPFQEMSREITNTFKKLFRQMGIQHPEREAMLFLAQIDGLTIQYLQDPSIPLNKLVRQLIKRYQP